MGHFIEILVKDDQGGQGGQGDVLAKVVLA